MASLNNVALTGNLTRDAEVVEFPNGGGIIKLGLAVNDAPYTNKDGDKVENANFIDVERFFGDKGPGGILSYLTKGKAIAVTGQLQQQRWETDDGNRSKIVVKARTVDLLSGGVGGASEVKAKQKSDAPF